MDDAADTCTTMAAEQLAGDDYEDFFRSSPPPENLDSVRAAVREFVMHHHGNSRLVVLITVRNYAHSQAFHIFCSSVCVQYINSRKNANQRAKNGKGLGTRLVRNIKALMKGFYTL